MSRLQKFRGINRNNFYLHLKECEFRFNYRKDNLYKKIKEKIKMLDDNEYDYE